MPPMVGIVISEIRRFAHCAFSWSRCVPYPPEAPLMRTRMEDSCERSIWVGRFADARALVLARWVRLPH